MTDVPSTPAGWFPDPDNAALLRYWDGRAWTEHRAPATAPPTHPTVVVRDQRSEGRKFLVGFAVVALIVFFVFVLPYMLTA